MPCEVAATRPAPDFAALYMPGWIASYPDALLLLDARLTILWANERARKLIGAHDDLAERDGRLCVLQNDEQARLAALIAALATHTERSAVLFGESRARTVVVDAWRLDGAGQEGDGPVAGVRLHWLRRRPKVNLAVLGTIHRLTTEERTTVGDILLGQTVADIAAKSGKAESTVRTHLKRVYSKMGVTSREQLFTECSAFFTPR